MGQSLRFLNVNEFQNIAACLLYIIMYMYIGEARTVRHTRAIWNFAYQLTHYFGAGQAFSLLDYGCFCGWYGEINPIDGVDQCCKDHDDCYGCVDACWPKTWPYAYDLQNKTVKCQDSPNSCKGRVCMCDKTFVDCLHNTTFNLDNYNINHDTHCEGRE